MEYNKSILVDEYISGQTPEVQEKLESIRNAIFETAPDAKEKISYGMPAYDFNGILVYYAAYKNHIGFYPASNGIEYFKDKIKDYKTSKGTIQFPLTESIPLELIREIVSFRLSENIAKKIKKRGKT